MSCGGGVVAEDGLGVYTYHQRPVEVLEPLIELGGVSEIEEDGHEELDEGGCGEHCSRRCHEAHEGDEGQNLAWEGVWWVLDVGTHLW